MNATKFNPGTLFNLDGHTYMVTRKTNNPTDNRRKEVWVARFPETADEISMFDSQDAEWTERNYNLCELEGWRKSGIIYNIVNA